MPLPTNTYRSMSAPITTHCFDSTDGSPTCASLEIEEIKSVPHAPLSHPFIERLIGTIRREYLDRMFFWNTLDLARKLGEFAAYYNANRVHRSFDGTTPAQRAGAPSPTPATLHCYAWQQHCRGLFQSPLPAR